MHIAGTSGDAPVGVPAWLGRNPALGAANPLPRLVAPYDVMAEHSEIQVLRPAMYVSREAPPPGPCRGLGGLGSGRAVRSNACAVQVSLVLNDDVSERSGSGDDGSPQGESTALQHTPAVPKGRGRSPGWQQRSRGQAEHLHWEDGSSTEEEELAVDSLEAAGVSGSAAGGVAHPVQHGKPVSVSSPVGQSANLSLMSGVGVPRVQGGCPV